MKKFFTLSLAAFTGLILSAQLTTEVVSPGVFKLTYGASDDYSFYDPGFEVPTFYVHTWISPADNSQNTSFDDSWNNSNVTMNYDSEAHAYVGTINLNTKVFTNTNNTVAAGTTVQKVGIVFKNQQDGATSQSGDTFVVGPTTLEALAVQNTDASQKSKVANGKLYTAKKGNLDISVYEFSGRLIKKWNVNANGNPIDLQLVKKGQYILQLNSANSKEVVKFVN